MNWYVFLSVIIGILESDKQINDVKLWTNKNAFHKRIKTKCPKSQTLKCIKMKFYINWKQKILKLKGFPCTYQFVPILLWYLILRVHFRRIKFIDYKQENIRVDKHYSCEINEYLVVWIEFVFLSLSMYKNARIL